MATWSPVAYTSEIQLFGTLGSSGIMWNAQTVNDDVTIGATQNGLSAGPVTVASGKAVTITSGGRWTVV